MRTSRHLDGRGFTLVELLVVMTIIGVLAGLISFAAVGAINLAKQTAVKIETDNLALAIESYKAKHGTYPPANLNFNDTVAVVNLRRHLSKAFPRYVFNEVQLKDDLQLLGVDVDLYNPANALVFWLSGAGPDVRDPFKFADKDKRVPLFDFDTARLIRPGGAGPMVYVPTHGNESPYAYIDAKNYHDPSTAWEDVVPRVLNGFQVNGQPAGEVAAYAVLREGVQQWANPDSFQIISAGQDGMFSSVPTPPGLGFPKVYPIGLNYTPEDADNVTNFSDKATLEAAKP